MKKPTNPQNDREVDFPETTPPQVIAKIGSVTTGIYPSVYAAARQFITDYKERYAPEAIFSKVPAPSTITNGVSRSSGGFYTTFITEDRGGKSTLPHPVTFQTISNE